MRYRLLVVVLLLASAPACFAEGGATDDEAAALAADPMLACPAPELGAIAGNESAFYLCAEDFAEQGAGCGDDGYLLGYGTRYSGRFFRDTRPRMSVRGQRWIDEVLVCLQHDLRDAIDSATSCDDIRVTAFDQHPQCYVDAGFCTLPFSDVLKIAWAIDLGDWTSRDALRQVVGVAGGCGREYSGWLRMLFWGV